jgi:D-threonate/D-erythronate kinase
MTGVRSQPPALLGLVADDLTGATDSAVGFAEHGWRVELILRPNDPPSTVPPTDPTPTVLAISTEARAQSDADAAQATLTAVDMLIRSGAQRLYLKIDSTVRGSIPGQLAGALQAWRQVHPGATAVVCPAFPAQRRTVVGGSVLVDGIPVAQTAAGTDPVTPRTVSHLAAIITGSTHGTLDQLGTQPVLVVDASTDADLDALAREASTADPSLIMVGSGGLAAALGRQWRVPATRPVSVPGAAALTVLVAVSSLHPVAIDQVDHLRRHLGDSQLQILTSTSATNVSAAGAATQLADQVAAELATSSYEALVLVGGDGAAAILRRVAASRVVVDSMISVGCPSGTIVGGQADGLRLVTKSGGFGHRETLTTIVRGLRDPTAEDSSIDTDRTTLQPTQKEAR